MILTPTHSIEEMKDKRSPIQGAFCSKEGTHKGPTQEHRPVADAAMSRCRLPDVGVVLDNDAKCGLNDVFQNL